MLPAPSGILPDSFFYARLSQDFKVLLLCMRKIAGNMPARASRMLALPHPGQTTGISNPGYNSWRKTRNQLPRKIFSI